MAKTALIALALLAVILAAGCARTSQMPGTAAPIESGVGSDVEQSLAELDSIEQELDMSELDTLDQELAAIDSLFE